MPFVRPVTTAAASVLALLATPAAASAASLPQAEAAPYFLSAAFKNICTTACVRKLHIGPAPSAAMRAQSRRSGIKSAALSRMVLKRGR